LGNSTSMATTLWWGLGIAPGPIKDLYSGCAEAYGIFAAVTFIQYYLAIFKTAFPPTTIKCFCDNVGIITNLTTLQSDLDVHPNNTTNDDCNIYLAIDDAIHKCANITFQFLHVKGHQDKDLKCVLLPEKQHNVNCDCYAEQHVLAQLTPSTAYNNLAFEVMAPHLAINGKLICRKVLPALRDAAAKPPFWAYLHKKFKWTYSDTTTIHWSTLNLTLHSLSWEDQHWIILFIHNKLPLCTSKHHPN